MNKFFVTSPSVVKCRGVSAAEIMERHRFRISSEQRDKKLIISVMLNDGSESTTTLIYDEVVGEGVPLIIDDIMIIKTESINAPEEAADVIMSEKVPLKRQIIPPCFTKNKMRKTNEDTKNEFCSDVL
jgi:hypothetical protein